MIHYLSFITTSLIAFMMSVSTVFSQNKYCNDKYCWTLREIKVVPYVDSNYIVQPNKKEVWPLNWIPPKHLRVDKYIYPSEESC